MSRRCVALFIFMVACESRVVPVGVGADASTFARDATVTTIGDAAAGLADARPGTDADASSVADAASMAADGGGLADAGAAAARQLFITSAFFDGNLLARVPGAADGLAAGDQLCRDAAVRAGLGGDWRAWLSSDTVDAIDRLQERGPWHDRRGALLFEDKARIADGPRASIWYDEAAQFLPSDRIWTGTIFDGTRGPMSATCASWSSGAMGELARIGQVGQSSDSWTFQTMTSCDQRAHLICFEQ